MHSESNKTGLQCDIHGKLSEPKTLKDARTSVPSFKDLPFQICLAPAVYTQELANASCSPRVCVCVC